MGTSASSTGPGSGVPLVPPWVDDVDNDSSQAPDGDNGTPQDQDEPTGKQDQSAIQPPAIAARARFRTTRTNLGSFSRGGDTDALKRGLGQYSRSGLGGARQASNRMARTARNSGILYSALNALAGRGNAPSDLRVDISQLRGLSAQEIVDRIAEAISPSDGSQDSEANRESISQALRELVVLEPDINLSALTEDQIAAVVESYISHDIFHRVELDVGKAIFSNTDPATAIQRLDLMYNYIRRCVSSALQRLDAFRKSLTQSEASRISRAIIAETFNVFEEYL